MEDKDKINIKLELNMDKNQNLSIVTYFDPNSSNFFKEGDYYLWKPTLKEKNLIIDAFRLIINSYIEKKKDEKIFKFSDKISEEENDTKNLTDVSSNNEDKYDTINTNEKLEDKKNIEKIIEKSNNNQEKIINNTIIKNKNIDKNPSDDETERKIEKILRDNKKID